LQKKIDAYFAGGMRKRKIVCRSGRHTWTEEVPVPTITGLVLYLGYADRVSFYDIEKKENFSYTIKSARTRIEREYEEMIQTANPAGPIFALKNFGWKDTPTVVVDQSTHERFYTNIIKKAGLDDKVIPGDRLNKTGKVKSG